MFTTTWNNVEPFLFGYPNFEKELECLFDAKPNKKKQAKVKFPAIRFGETKENYYLYALVPGISKENLEITLNEVNLEISGSRGATEGKENQYFQKERFTGSFSRTITLPENIDSEKIIANFKNGILELVIGKRIIEPKKISITTKE